MLEGTVLVVVILAIAAIGVMIWPTKRKQPKDCTCVWGVVGMTVDYDCPHHGDHIQPLYPIEEIRTAAMSEREKACHDSGLYVNKLLKNKWSRDK